MTIDSVARTTTGGTKARLLTRPLALTLLAGFAALNCFYLLLSVTPKYAQATGTGESGAGLVTGLLLLGTVAAELTSARLNRRFGYRAVLAAGAVLMGVPTLVLLIPGALSLATLAAVAVACGYGFGLGTVADGAILARLVPPDRLGEGLGLHGFVECVPAIVALPAGLWISGHWGPSTVAALAAGIALVPLVALPRVPEASDGPGPSEQAPGLLKALRHGGQWRPFLMFGATTIAAGTVASLLPLATGVSGGTAALGLLVQALTATAGRWWAGRSGDRRGHGRLLVPGLVVAGLGMVCLVRLDVPAVVIAGMCLFGAGFGTVQNATFALMIERSPASDPDSASALWNLAFDAGFGAGPALSGLLAAHTGYPAAFALAGLPMLLMTPAARPDSRSRRRCASARAAGAGYGR